jgi:hypothetical protein
VRIEHDEEEREDVERYGDQITLSGWEDVVALQTPVGNESDLEKGKAFGKGNKLKTR